MSDYSFKNSISKYTHYLKRSGKVSRRNATKSGKVLRRNAKRNADTSLPL
jgi:hypothetical protein